MEGFNKWLLDIDPDVKIRLQRRKSKAYGASANITLTCKSVEPSEARKKKELAAKEANRAENSVTVAKQLHGSYQGARED